MENEEVEPQQAAAATAPERSAKPRRLGRLRSHGLAFLLGALGALAAIWFWPAAQPPEHGERLPWVTPSQLRQTLPAYARLTLDDAPQAVAVVAEIPGSLDPGRAARVTVSAPDASRILEQELPPSALQRGSVVLVLRSARGLAGGIYELLFDQDDGLDPVELQFELSLPESEPASNPAGNP